MFTMSGVPLSPFSASAFPRKIILGKYVHRDTIVLNTIVFNTIVLNTIVLNTILLSRW